MASLDAHSVMRIAVPMAALSSSDHAHTLWQHLQDDGACVLTSGQSPQIGLIDDTVMLLGGSDTPETTQTPTLPQQATLGEARHLFLQHGPALRLIPLRDRDGGYSGYCASRHALRTLLLGQACPAPPRMGGMATPLGVYLSSGRYCGGASGWGLALNGVAMALAMALAQGMFMAAMAMASVFVPALNTLSVPWQVWLESVFLIGFLLGAIRLTPLSGLHAAEHMTINALEQGQPLTPEAVGAQSRVHQRCGTHLVALLAGVQLGWLMLEAMRPTVNPMGQLVFLLLWVILVSRYWRRVGAWLQTHFTTRPPTRAQLHSGMAAAQAVLRQYAQHPHGSPGIWQRLWFSGLVQVLAAFFATQWLLDQAMGTLAPWLLPWLP